MNSIIEVKNLSFGYNANSILENISLSVNSADFVAIAGPNGAGKTTTLKILTGMMKPSSGKAMVAGEEVKLNSVRLRQKIGYLGQEPRMYGWMKGLELLIFVGKVLDFQILKASTGQMKCC